jgi:hypothetical protein
MHPDGLFNPQDLLRIGSLSVAGSRLPASIAYAASGGVRGRAKSVIYLWMGVGLTRIESLDARPDVPEARTTHGAAPADVAATFDAALGVHYRAIVRDLLDRPLPVLDHGEPIPEMPRPSVNAKRPPKGCVSQWSRYCRRSSAAKECLHLGRLSTSEVIRHGHCACC